MGQVKYSVVSTKIAKSDKEKIVKIAKKFDMNLYQLMQSLMLALVRYFDEESLSNDELNIMVSSFIDVIAAIKGSFNPLSPPSRYEENITKAFFFVQRKKDERPQIIEVGKDNNGKLTKNYNIDDMLSEFLRILNPNTLKEIEKEKQELGYFSITQTLQKLINERKEIEKDEIGDEVKSLFTDIRVSGQHVNEDIYYKKKVNKGDYTAVSIRPKKFIHADLL